MVDIFGQLNKQTILIQARNTNIMKFVDALNVFKSKHVDWHGKDITTNVAMLEKLTSIVDVCGGDNSLPLIAENKI